MVHVIHAKFAEFAFFPPNHSVGRAEYQQPCIPYEDTGEEKVGFWSGFFPVDKVLSNVSSTPGDYTALLKSSTAANMESDHQ